MKVLKRNGQYEDVKFDKVFNRIRILSGKKDNDLMDKDFKNEFISLNVDPTLIAQKVCSEIYDKVKTSELDELASQISIALYPKNPDYGDLASRISISNIHKNTPHKFSDAIEYLYKNKILNGRTIIADYLYNIVIDYFGFKTLEKSYLLKSNGKIIERPQYLFMRVALCIHRDNIDDAIATYHLLSNKYYTHATPTLFNAGTNRDQFSSCFLLTMEDDSVDGIFNTLKKCKKDLNDKFNEDYDDYLNGDYERI